MSKIDKITFKNEEAWIVFRSEDIENRYLGTWHTQDAELVKWLRQKNPKKIKFEDIEEQSAPGEKS